MVLVTKGKKGNYGFEVGKWSKYLKKLQLNPT
jgi:hypothetical protein